MEQRNQFIDLSLVVENDLQKGSNELLNQTKNYNTLNKKILSIQSLNYKDEKEYQLLINGILNGMLFDENMNIDNYFQILYSINIDSYKTFLKLLADVLEFSKIKKDKYIKIYQIFEKLNKINADSSFLIEIIILISRNIYPGQELTYSIINNNNVNNDINNNHNQNLNPNNIENISTNFFYQYLMFIKSNLDFIFKNDMNINLSGLTFIKILRLLIETHIYHHVYKLNNYDSSNELNNNNTYSEITNTYQKIGFNDKTKKLISEIYDAQIFILTKIYQEKKNKVYEIGRELIRLLISIGRSNIEIINTIFADLLNNNYYDTILNISSIRTNIYAQINVPPLMERMIIYILTSVKKDANTYKYYLNWLYREFKIENCIGKTILVDLTRFIMTHYNFYFKNNYSDCVPRWLILSYILMHAPNHILSSEIKQVLFMDLILFDKNKDHYYMVEPPIISIINNMNDCPDFSQELIEFLDSYVKHFDKKNIQKRMNSVCEAFKIMELKDNNNNLEKIIKGSKMQENFKKILIDLIKNNNNDTISTIDSNSNNNNKNEPIKDLNNYNNDDNNNKNNIGNNNIKDKDINNNKINDKNNNNNINVNQLLLNSNNNDILKQFNEKNMNQNKNQTQTQVQNQKEIKDKDKDKKIERLPDKNEEINIDIIIPKEFNEYVKNITLKNFLTEKSRKNFDNILNDICNYNIKKYGKSNTGLKNLDTSYKSLCNNFAEFFIKVFKDELEFNDFDNLELNKNKNDKNKQYIYTHIFDFAYQKNKDIHTFSFIADLINKIIDIYKPFILHLMAYTLYNTINKKKNENYNGLTFFYQINNKDIKLVKYKLNLFFTQCEDNFLMYYVRDFFKYGGVELFKEAIFDDEYLIFKIIRNCDLNSIHTIKMSIINNNYILIDKTFLNLCRYSFLLSPSEKHIFWNLISAQKNIPSVSLKDFLLFCLEFLNNPPTSNSKEESIKINYDEFFDKIINSINLFKKEIFEDIHKSSWEELGRKLMYIFDFDENLKKYIYQVIDSILENIRLDDDKKRVLFSFMVQQYFKDNNKDINKLKRLIKLLNYFSEIHFENNKNINTTDKKNNENNIGWFSDDIRKVMREIMNRINHSSNS